MWHQLYVCDQGESPPKRESRAEEQPLTDRADLSAPVDVYCEWVDAAGEKSNPIEITSSAYTNIPLFADAVAQVPQDSRSDFAGTSQASASRRMPASRLIDEEGDRRYAGEGIVADDGDYD